MREVYQTDSCVRQRRIVGFDLEIAGIRVVGYAERTLTTSSRVEQPRLFIFLMSGDCLDRVTRLERRTQRTSRGTEFDSPLRRIKVNARLRVYILWCRATPVTPEEGD